MKKPIYVHSAAHDDRLDSIGITINPPSETKKTKKQEFFQDLIGLLIVPELIGLFIIEWIGFLIGKHILRKDLEKPEIKR